MTDPDPRPDHVARIQQAWRVARPDLDPSPQGVIGRLHRLGGRLTEELLTVYRRYELAEGDFDALCALRRAGEPFERTPGELARTTLITTGGMTKRIDKLESRGLVVRRPSVSDGRSRVVALTPAGKELIDRAFTAHMANEHRLVSTLSTDEFTQLEGLLTRWLATFEPPEAPAADTLPGDDHANAAHPAGTD